MEYRRLGPTGIKVSVISLGNWLNSNTKQAEQNTVKCLQTAWDNGINFFDTAQGYGFGQAEVQFGKALKALNVPRHKYVLSTKIYWGAKENLPNRKGLSRKHVIEGLRASLKRLDVGYVDVVFCHRHDRETPIQQTCRAFDWVIRKGWSIYWGTSEWSAGEINQALMICDKYGLQKPVVEQPQYNLYSRSKMQIDYRNLFAQKKLGTTVWSPLLSGILTGKYNKGFPENNRFQKNPDIIHIYNRYFTTTKQSTLQNLNKFEEYSKQLGCSMAQLALAWVINNPDVSTAITGASNPNQLIDSLQALEVRKKLTAEVQKKIQQIFKTAPIGKRNMAEFVPHESRRIQLLK